MVTQPRLQFLLHWANRSKTLRLVEVLLYDCAISGQLFLVSKIRRIRVCILFLMTRYFYKENFGGNGFELSTDLQNPQDKYYGVSALSAGYVMFDNKLSSNVRLIWGSRFEYFEQFLKSNQQGTDKAQVIDTDKFDVLPSVNLTISPNSKTNIRVSGSRTVARPEFREIAPFIFFDFEQIASTAGTPDLRRSSIINGDIRYEWYPKAGELLSLGVFYKDFTDPIELRLNSASVATRRQYQFQNAEKAQLFGIEAEFRKNLSFFSSSATWLERFYFNGNVSIIISEVTLGNVDASGNKLPATNVLCRVNRLI